MSYKRVIPRDLFNESNLLFQIGQLYLELAKIGKENLIQHDGKRFKTFQDVDGDLSVKNVWLQVGDERWDFCRSLNSRDRFGMWVVQPADRDLSVWYVFNDAGELHEEFHSQVLDTL